MVCSRSCTYGSTITDRLFVYLLVLIVRRQSNSHAGNMIFPFSAIGGWRKSQALHILRVRSSLKQIFSRWGIPACSVPSSFGFVFTHTLKETVATAEWWIITAIIKQLCLKRLLLGKKMRQSDNLGSEIVWRIAMVTCSKLFADRSEKSELVRLLTRPWPMAGAES